MFTGSREHAPGHGLLRHLRDSLSGMGLTKQVALLTLIPVAIMGFFIASYLEQQVERQALSDARQSVGILERLDVQGLSPQDVQNGLSPQQIRTLNAHLAGESRFNLTRIEIINARGRIVYSSEPFLIGTIAPKTPVLSRTLRGGDISSQLLSENTGEETSSKQILAAYSPLWLAGSITPMGIFEIHLRYAPVAGFISTGKGQIALYIYSALAILWLLLLPIIYAASRRIHSQAKKNHTLAYYDQLTGLPNRILFNKKAADYITDGATAIFLIGLDRFKEINDTLGHKAGDHVLREFAERLKAQIEPGTLLARLGSDEFALLSPHASNSMAQAAAIQACLDDSFHFGDTDVNVDASIGITVSRGPLSLLLRQADMALARAKAGRTGVEIYSKDHDTLSTKHLKLLAQVRPALRRGEFILHYQPKIDLTSRSITGVEALVRWQHPELGILPPIDFIPLIERTSLITPLTLYAIDHALAQMAAWNEEGLRLEVAIAVNLSTRDLANRTLPHEIERLLIQHNIPATQLTLEVTESATMSDPAGASQTLGALRDLGIGISIDDFGTGNASIAYLANLPATEIKIDRSFIAKLVEDKRSEAIVHSIIELASNLGLSVVAEGIETEEILKRLTEMGCTTGQGYLFSRPVDAEELFRASSSRMGGVA